MLMVILRLVHIVLGVLWVGSVFALTIVIAPGMQQLGLPLDPLMRTLQHRKFTQLMMSFGGLTVLAGLAMFYLLSRGNGAEFMDSTFGRTLGVGGLAAILALVLGGSIQRPAMDRIARLKADLGSNPPKGDDPRVAQVAALQQRIVTTGKLVFALLLLAVTCMAVARYL